MSNSSKIAFNTLALYINMVLAVVTLLLTTRIVLATLGKEEFGLSSLIASSIALLSFLYIAMSAAIQRFVSFAIGAKHVQQIKEIFNQALLLHLGFGLLVVVVTLGVGIPIVKYFLAIPEHLTTEAILLTIAFAFNLAFIIISVPAEAMMNAYEDMHFIAGANITDSCLKLGSALVITQLDTYQLSVYGFLIAGTSLASSALKHWFAYRRYEAISYRLRKVEDFTLLRSMVSFAGWNFFGAGCSIIRYQGVSILLGRFFNLLIVSAYGVSQQIYGFVVFLANSLVRPIRPVVIKYVASGNQEHTFCLCFTATKLTSLMLAIVIIPLVLNIEHVLVVWLGSPPAMTAEFATMLLAQVFIFQLSTGLLLALESINRIKQEQLISGIGHLISILIGTILLARNFPPITIMVCIIIEEVIVHFIRLRIVYKSTGIQPSKFSFQVTLPICLCLAIAYTAAKMLPQGHSWGQLFATSAVSTAIISTVGYFFVLNKFEQKQIKSFVYRAKQKFFGKA